jgi:hypothetical protein
MKHGFTFKLIGNLNTDLLNQFKTFVVNIEYETTNDFVDYAIKIGNIPLAIKAKFINLEMSKYFKPEGHIGSNIARMEPNSYVSEHSDYTANTYGKMQDSIIKLQIPIITNSAAGMMWRHAADGGDRQFGAHNLLPKKNRSAAMSFIEGGIYAIDNCRVHSSVNFGSEQRFWLTSRWNVNSIVDDSILA